MDTNRDEFQDDLIHGPLMYSIVGAALEVMKGIGPGVGEKPYERALVVELRLREHHIDQQRRFELRYKGEFVGEYVPDLIVEDAVIVETKVVERITDVERAQVLNYMRISGIKIGLIINFRRPKLEWQRLIL